MAPTTRSAARAQKRQADLEKTSAKQSRSKRLRRDAASAAVTSAGATTPSNPSNVHVAAATKKNKMKSKEEKRTKRGGRRQNRNKQKERDREEARQQKISKQKGSKRVKELMKAKVKMERIETMEEKSEKGTRNEQTGEKAPFRVRKGVVKMRETSLAGDRTLILRSPFDMPDGLAQPSADEAREELSEAPGPLSGLTNVELTDLPTTSPEGIRQLGAYTFLASFDQESSASNACGKQIGLRQRAYSLEKLGLASHRFFICANAPLGGQEGVDRSKMVQSLLEFFIPTIQLRVTIAEQYNEAGPPHVMVETSEAVEYDQLSFEVPVIGKTNCFSHLIFQPIDEEFQGPCIVCKSDGHLSRGCVHFRPCLLQQGQELHPRVVAASDDLQQGTVQPYLLRVDGAEGSDLVLYS